MTTQAIALKIAYQGTAYRGWQRQPQAPSIQAWVEQALAKVADSPVEIVCAGRTDAGVHASHQVVSFVSPHARPMKAWIHGVNQHLPADIRVHQAVEVDGDFHARFSAQYRRYFYLLQVAPVNSAFCHSLVTTHYYPLDSQAMHAAAQCLVGEQDFSAFRAAGCQSKTPMRYVEHCRVIEHQSRIMVDIQANAFLHHMVRNIVGTLIPIGEGHQPVSHMQAVLDTRDRTQAGVTAPPQGLYLVDVGYPETIFSPGQIGPDWLGC